LEILNIRYIAVDGVDGSGKSTLARSLSEALKIVHINLDDYLKKNRGGFVDYLDYSSINKRILGTNSKVIIEGVFILAVLKV
jgi:thymidylate kinase